MNKTEVQIIALNGSESSPGNYSLVLEEVNSSRRLPIIIGAFEAQAIAVYMERMQINRPMTHDLLKTVISSLGAQLKEVIIHSLKDGAYHASLVLSANGTELLIDARSSDALALAVRVDCPVYINAALLEENSLMPDTKRASLLKGSLAEYSIEELKELLEDLLAKEDYESASRVRDMIKKREG